MNDLRIPVTDIRAAQNRCLELLGLDPVSEIEYENMHHHDGDDFMTEYRYNRRGTADRVEGTVTEWVSIGESVERGHGHRGWQGSKLPGIRRLDG